MKEGRNLRQGWGREESSLQGASGASNQRVRGQCDFWMGARDRGFSLSAAFTHVVSGEWKVVHGTH